MSRKNGCPLVGRHLLQAKTPDGICRDCADFAPTFSCGVRSRDPPGGRRASQGLCASYTVHRDTWRTDMSVNHGAGCLDRAWGRNDVGPCERLRRGDCPAGEGDIRKKRRCRADSAAIDRRSARASANAGIDAARRGGSDNRRRCHLEPRQDPRCRRQDQGMHGLGCHCEAQTAMNEERVRSLFRPPPPATSTRERDGRLPRSSILSRKSSQVWETHLETSRRQS
jgi:hypothetical protein